MNRLGRHQLGSLPGQTLITRLVILPVLALGLSVTHLAGQENRLLVTTWNLLAFPDHYAGRLDDIQLVLSQHEPDILAINELKSASGGNILNNSVLQPISSDYTQAPFVANEFLNNTVFFNTKRVTLLGSVTITTALRDIEGFTFRINDHVDSTFSFTIFVAHLKASSSETDKLQRWAEVSRLKAHIAQQDSDFHYIFAGDLNLYDANEPAYKLLLDSMSVDLEDPVDSPGVWHDSDTFRLLHTQSTRYTQLADGGSYAGLDDRFDFILLSHHMLEDSAALAYVSGSYQAYGNDGLHLNKSINDGSNAMVPADIANALYTASDHLPVLLELVYPADPTHAIRENHGKDTPTAYRLYPNYPNPFNANTTIRYDLPAATYARLIVYDLLGREIALLKAGWQPAGSYSYLWDTRATGNPDLSSGLYILRLITPDYATSGRLILQK